MKIKGTIFKKRTYFDSECRNLNCITFIQVDPGLLLNGCMIKILPILSPSCSMVKIEGDLLEVEGKVEFHAITTVMGNRNLHPVPVMKEIRSIS
ncbi:hypothetical protein [Ammoniphilus sp. 3BR4]|uniref:hypothetical protein n=1 Tax=Ammoniphilus sp. 3BR4 TaxID=3158265 RepID=UPI003466DB02